MTRGSTSGTSAPRRPSKSTTDISTPSTPSLSSTTTAVSSPPVTTRCSVSGNTVSLSISNSSVTLPCILCPSLPSILLVPFFIFIKKKKKKKKKKVESLFSLSLCFVWRFSPSSGCNHPNCTLWRVRVGATDIRSQPCGTGSSCKVFGGFVDDEGCVLMKKERGTNLILADFQSQMKRFPEASPEMTKRPSGEKWIWQAPETMWPENLFLRFNLKRSLVEYNKIWLSID
eukprot:284815455_4